MNRLINTTDVSSQLPPPSHTPTPTHTPTHGIQRECYPLKTRSSAPPLITSTIDVLKNINWKYILNFCCEWNVKMTFSDRGPCDENRRDVCLSNHNSIWCLTFDMQIDRVTVLMQWMDFPVRQAGPVCWHFNQLIFSEPVSTAKFSGWRRSRRVLRVFSHRILETRPRHILTHVLKELLGSYTDDTCAGGSRQQRGWVCSATLTHTHTQEQCVLISLFCLSAPVCEAANLFVWTHSWSEVRTVLTGTNRKVSGHIVHAAHILFIQFWEIAMLEKRLSLFCHLASQVTFTDNTLGN